MRYSSRASFIKSIKSSMPDHLSRVFLIAAADDFERGEAIQALVDLIAHPDRMLGRFSGAEFDRKGYFEHLQTASLFGGEPIALLDEVEKIGKKEQQEVLPDPLRYGYLILGTRSKIPLAAAVEKQGVILDLLDEKPWDKEKRLAEELRAKASSAGKALDPDVIPFLFEGLDKDAALLHSEMDKLICYTGDKPRIQAADAAAICSSSRSYSSWQTAEELVWEGRALGNWDESAFHSLIPALRAQLQLGMKIASLLSTGASREEWTQALPRVYPKTLEKRTSQASRLGLAYFSKGLEELFRIELLSRTGSQQYEALLTLFRGNHASR